MLPRARALDVRGLGVLPPKIVRPVEDLARRRNVYPDQLRSATRRLLDLLEGAAELVPVHRRAFRHSRPHSYLSFIIFCVFPGIYMEKVVVSLGGSVLVPGEDDARYLADR